ncbi:TetR/AcrR family transcriptional regulator [Dethiothermospora halolimnae]|uniref:TetR/AcrR family transcriptional regulator n=1 Tax=Dethiothermospora halolimnae TaxID=3114390 RepID=UPI003CCBFA12
MFDKFEKLPEEKKEKIINACIEEFAKYGYEKSSTNRIIKRADISKGILFHYFGNKKSLYLYIVDYAMNYYSDKVDKCIENIETKDIFERIKAWSLIKLKLFSEEPLMYYMTFNIFFKGSDKIKSEIQERYAKLSQKYMNVLIDGIDREMFRDDIDTNKAIDLLLVTFDGIGNKYVELYKRNSEKLLADFEDIIVEIDEYMDILKKGFYKE